MNKPKGRSSFSLIPRLRRLLGVSKIGHAGTLDPFATGVLVMLVGRAYTRLSSQFLESDKEYWAELCLGIATDTYDCDGVVTKTSSKVPSIDEVKTALLSFQGEVSQIPPMYSAKKQQGQKLYELARRGIEVERPALKIRLTTELLHFHYPTLQLRIQCTKGTYIRSIANDLGMLLDCPAYLTNLTRLRSGHFELESCLSWDSLEDPSFPLQNHLITTY